MAKHFNPEAFMAASIQGALDTRTIPCPVGEHQMISTKVEIKSGEIKNGDRAGEIWAGYEITYEVLSEEAKRVTGKDKVFSRQMIMLDLTDEGMLDMGKGKNVRLGKVREAMNQNDASQPWNVQMMVGHTVMGIIGHRPDPKDNSILYDEVTGVRKI